MFDLSRFVSSNVVILSLSLFLSLRYCRNAMQMTDGVGDPRFVIHRLFGRPTRKSVYSFTAFLRDALHFIRNAARPVFASSSFSVVVVSVGFVGRAHKIGVGVVTSLPHRPMAESREPRST